MQNINLTNTHFNTEQGRLPVFFSDMLDICDPVLTFDKIMEEIKVEKYLKAPEYKELTKYHQEVINNLESTHGILLRMNRSI